MSDRIQAILSYLHSERYLQRDREPMACGGHDTEAPFFTISREAGAGGDSLAQLLCDRMNVLDTATPPWTAFDRALIDRVVSDHDVAAELVETIGDGGRSWINEIFEGLTIRGRLKPSDLRVYRMVAETVLALAEAGRVVLVGRGSAMITHRRTGGVHVRLVAPLSHRIEYTSWSRQLTRSEAIEFIRRTERRREMFYKQFWPGETRSPSSFTVTFNTAESGLDTIVDALVAMLPGYAPQRIAVREQKPEHEDA